eukprot:gene12562-biopygen275
MLPFTVIFAGSSSGGKAGGKDAGGGKTDGIYTGGGIVFQSLSLPEISGERNLGSAAEQNSVAAKRCAGGGINAGSGTALAAKLPVVVQLAAAIPVAAWRKSGGKENLATRYPRET